jgi:general secretion pathway protein D
VAVIPISIGVTAVPISAQQPGDSVMIRIANTDLRSAVQVLGQYLDRPVVFTGQSMAQVSLETPRPIPRGDVVRLLRGLLETQNFELIADSTAGMYRARAVEAPRAAAPSPAPVATQFSSQPRQQGAPELFVIPLKHARAADVASSVNSLYGHGPSNGGTSRPTTLAEDLRASQIPAAGAPLPQSVPGVAGRSAALTGEVMIVADARANTLLIRANRSDFELINAVVQQLDVRPLQVLIEVLIAEVRRDRSLSLGIEATAENVPVGTRGLKVSGSAGGPGLGDFALKVMGIAGVDLDASLRIAAEKGDVKVLSRPIVLAANNEEAEIVVGTQRPFVQVQRALPTDSPVRDQVIQYKEVGTKLTVKPTISGDGSVQLEVTQEVSNATGESQFNAPVISTRSVRTDLLIADGRTVALGGLTDRQKDVVRSGIPLLSSIPFIGGLFGSSSTRTTETELFVFLTPRVIRTDDDAARLTAPLQDRAGKIRP